MISLLLATVLTGAPEQLLFEHDGDWIVLSSDGVVQTRFREVRGLRPLDLALSPSGERWAAVDRLNDKLRLHLFQTDSDAVRAFEAPGTVLDGLAFSRDGAWVYLSANDSTSALPAGSVMNYAQVYRVNFESGAFHRLSNSRGCHMWPRPMGGGRVAFSHANCRGGRGASILNERLTSETVLLPNDIPNSTMDVAHDSATKRLLIVEDTGRALELREWNMRTGKRARLWAKRPRTTSRLRPQWVAGGRAILFQEQGAVLLTSDDGALTTIARIAAEREQAP